MISISHPEILPILQKLNYGLLPCYIQTEKKFLLIVKATKEIILTARTKNEFKIYLLNNRDETRSYLGLVTAFFDDHDEPLILQTHLFANDEFLHQITVLFSQSEFDLYFFDEHNREFMGVKAINKDYSRFHSTITKALFNELNLDETLNYMIRLESRFSSRNTEDDAKAFEIFLGERIYPDDFIIMDNTQSFHGYNDSPRSAAITSLERGIDPGPMQERDIAMLFMRVFDKNSIYLNPFRADTGLELTDVLIVTEKIILFVQAKDSPNTEDSLGRTIERKKSITRSQISKATKQLRGALNYGLVNETMELKILNGTIAVPTKGKQLVGLIVVREMFDDDYFECSAPVLDLTHKLQTPIGLLGYSQLHLLSKNLNTSLRFTNGLHELIRRGIHDGFFPKPVWSKPLPDL